MQLHHGQTKGAQLLIQSKETNQNPRKSGSLLQLSLENRIYEPNSVRIHKLREPFPGIFNEQTFNCDFKKWPFANERFVDGVL